MKFIIEHLEKELYEWCLIEYQHISEIVGKNSTIFTNINKKNIKKLKKYGIVFEKSVSELKFNNLCVLSQYSKKALATNDKSRFEYFVFGGILGDNPSKKRTNILIRNLKKHNVKFETRSLRNKQKKLSDFKFVDELEIELNENESVVLPFRYVVDNKKLIINEELVEYLRKRKEF